MSAERSTAKICVLLATYRRAESLRGVLESLAVQNLAGLTLTVIIVDNAGDEPTRAVVESFAGRVAVTLLTETVKRGKSSALNRALDDLPPCDLLVLTDDDIVADPNWIAELWAGTQRWPDADIFGGRILPRFPNGEVTLNVGSPWIRTALAIQDDQGGERIVPHGKLWGPNLAIKPRVLASGIRFNANIGPAGADYVTGCEVDFTRRLEDAGSKCVFIPTASVGHVIREEQVTEEWLYKRAFKHGRGEAVRNPAAGQVILFGAPRWIYREYAQYLVQWAAAALTFNRAARIDARMGVEFSRGLLAQYRK